MGILSGFKKFKRYIRVGDDYILDSEWTSSETVQMGDGNTLEKNLGDIKGITDSLDTENSNIAASAKAVNTLKQSVEQKSDSSHDHDSRYFTETEITDMLNGYAKKSQIGTKITATLEGTTLYLNF